MAMKLVFLYPLLLAPLLLCPPSFGLDFQVSLSAAEVLPQAPVGLQVVAIPEGTESGFHAAYIMTTDLKVALARGDGSAIPVSREGDTACDSEPDRLWTIQFADSTTWLRDYPLSQWASTNLPAGDYKIIVQLHSVAVARQAIGMAETLPFSPPKRWEIPLRISTPNDARVRALYEEIWSEAKALQPLTTASDVAIRQKFLLDTLTFSQEAAATPVQLRMFRGEIDLLLSPGLTLCQLLTVANTFIARPSPEVARYLTDWLGEDIQFAEGSTKQAMTDLVLWVLFEMQEKGGPEIGAITEATLSQFSKPAYPLRPQGLD